MDCKTFWPPTLTCQLVKLPGEVVQGHLGRLRGPTTITRRVPDRNRGPQITFSHVDQYDGFVMTLIEILGFISERNEFF